MATRYGRFKNTADRLLTKWGNTITLSTVDRTVLGTFIGVKAPVRVDNTPDSVIQRSTATVYVTNTNIVPLPNQYVTVDGQDYIIIYVEPVSPADETVMYTLFVSNGG